MTVPVRTVEKGHVRRTEDDDEPPVSGGKRTVLIGAVVIAALAVVFLLFKSILGSFSAPAVDQYQVPNVLGMTIEEAENDPRVKGIF